MEIQGFDTVPCNRIGTLKTSRKINVLAHEALREVPTLSSKTLKTLGKPMILQETCTTFLEREYASLSETIINHKETKVSAREARRFLAFWALGFAGAI